jgi:predicted nucleic acid-binding protein
MVGFADGSMTACTSQLTKLECVRLLRRARIDADQVAEGVGVMLNSVTMVGLGEPVLSVAASLANPDLRSLDTIHVATALLIDADAVVTYDERLRWAAFAEGLAVIQPGVAPGPLPEGWGWIEGSTAP